MGWAVLAAGLLLLVLAVRIPARGARGLTQGCAVLVAVLGAILLLRRPGSPLLPGYGPRQWRQP